MGVFSFINLFFVASVIVSIGGMDHTANFYAGILSQTTDSQQELVAWCIDSIKSGKVEPKNINRINDTEAKIIPDPDPTSCW